MLSLLLQPPGWTIVAPALCPSVGRSVSQSFLSKPLGLSALLGTLELQLPLDSSADCHIRHHHHHHRQAETRYELALGNWLLVRMLSGETQCCEELSPYVIYGRRQRRVRNRA